MTLNAGRARSSAIWRLGWPSPHLSLANVLLASPERQIASRSTGDRFAEEEECDKSGSYDLEIQERPEAMPLEGLRRERPEGAARIRR